MFLLERPLPVVQYSSAFVIGKMLGVYKGRRSLPSRSWVEDLYEGWTCAKAAMEYAEIMRDSSPMVVRTIKRFVRDTVVQRGPSELSALAQRELLSVSRGEDQQEGGRAFKEKRKPFFKEVCCFFNIVLI